MKKRELPRKGSHISDSERLEYLDSLRVAAIFMVVGIHAMGYSHTLSDTEFKIIDYIVHTIAVPVFYLVDGFLFARKYTGSSPFNYLDYIKKSTHRLFIPWLIFSILYAISRYIFEFLNILDDKILIGHSFFDMTVAVYGSLIASQLYFLLSLFIIRLFSFIIAKAIKVQRGYILYGFLAYMIIYKSLIGYILPILNIQGGQEPVIHAIYGFQFYFFGILLFLFKEKFTRYLTTSAIFLMLLSIIFHFYSDGLLKDFFSKYLYIFGIYLFFLKYQFNHGLIKTIGQNTMGIYLLHSPILLKAISIGVNPFIKSPIFSYLFILIIDFWISFGITLILKKNVVGRIMMGIPNPSRKIKNSGH